MDSLKVEGGGCPILRSREETQTRRRIEGGQKDFSKYKNFSGLRWINFIRPRSAAQFSSRPGSWSSGSWARTQTWSSNDFGPE